jgi:hypothetical protein
MARTAHHQLPQWEQPYLKVNERLARGESVGRDEIAERFGFQPLVDNRATGPVKYPRLGVYAGQGASHSWIWFVELFDTIGLYDVLFLDEEDLCEGGLQGIDALLIGGGDTYAIAEALNEKGANELRGFVAGGGVYVGTCAGAYLLLDLAGLPFTPFSGFTRVRMANVTKSLPQCRCLPTKFSAPYNGSYVIHPVRESLQIEPSEESFFSERDTLLAPLYGGPSMVPSGEEAVLARYCGFDKETIFLTDENVAEEMFLGKAAAIVKRLGNGTLWLFGPHFEHPHYPVANSIIAQCLYSSIDGGNSRDYPAATQEIQNSDDALIKAALKDVKRELSNARITAAALETKDVHWQIGEKSYEPEKIRFFLETMWGRLLWLLKQRELLPGKQGDFENLRDMSWAVARVIKDLAAGLQEEPDTTPIAEKLFVELKKATALLLGIYFGNKHKQLRERKPRTLIKG